MVRCRGAAALFDILVDGFFYDCIGQAAASLLFDISAENGDRCLRQFVLCICAGVNSRSYWWAVWIRVSHVSFWMPLKLGLPKSSLSNRAGEEAILTGFRIREIYLYRMVVIMISIHKHDGPASVWPFDRVGGDQNISGCIRDVA